MWNRVNRMIYGNVYDNDVIIDEFFNIGVLLYYFL